MSLAASPAQSLTPLQTQVAALLAAGATITDAAAQSGVTRQTIHTWRNTTPAFEAAIA